MLKNMCYLESSKLIWKVDLAFEGSKLIWKVALAMSRTLKREYLVQGSVGYAYFKSIESGFSCILFLSLLSPNAF